MDLPSRSALFQVGRQALINAPDSRINPLTVDVSGSDINLQVGAGSVMGEEIVAAISQCALALFVATARGALLDRVVYDRFQLTRLPAAPATVDLTLARPAPGAGGTIFAGSRVQTPAGTIFALDVDVAFAGGDTTKTTPGTALIAGPDGNVGAGTITQLLDQPFDPTFTVTNAAGAAGGTDAETDATFRGRAFDFFRSIRRATIQALEFGARQVPGVAISRVIEILNPSTGFPAGMVEEIIGDTNGGASSTLIREVATELLNWRAAGIPVFISGGTVVYQPVSWVVAFLPGIDEVQATQELIAVTSAVTQFLKPGDTLYRSALIGAGKTVPGIVISDRSLLLPLGDVVPPNNQTVIRTRAQDVTVNG